jgi:hypothetical protein
MVSFHTPIDKLTVSSDIFTGRKNIIATIHFDKNTGSCCGNLRFRSKRNICSNFLIKGSVRVEGGPDGAETSARIYCYKQVAPQER